MFETLTLQTLQQYWWVIISLLGAFLVFLLFVQGGQTLIYTLGKTDDERTLLINSLGRKWEFTFTTLVTFGGAFFASFPLFYATSFGGAYWVWMLILFCFIIQAVSYEFRSKPGNVFGHKTFETFLFINGSLGPLLLGIAVATFFTGSQFSVNMYHSSRWETPFHGLEAALNMRNLSLGLSVLFLARISGILYFMNSVTNDKISERAKKQLLYNAIPFVVFFVLFTVWLLLGSGYALDPQTGIISIEKYKYLHNFLAMPLVLIMFALGVILVLSGILYSIIKTTTKGIWNTGVGTILTVFSLFLVAGLNNTAFYPSSFDLQSSLTIQNSSSSHYTLAAMSYVSLLVPVVLAYIIFAWRAINKKQISLDELKEDTHIY
jgi:cytochrome d ubiquinol oxidase subunit II